MEHQLTTLNYVLVEHSCWDSEAQNFVASLGVQVDAPWQLEQLDSMNQIIQGLTYVEASCHNLVHMVCDSILKLEAAIASNLPSSL